MWDSYLSFCMLKDSISRLHLLCSKHTYSDIIFVTIISRACRIQAIKYLLIS